MNTVNDNKGISLQEIMKDEEIRTINDIQYNEERILELSLPYYTELKSISNEYLPMGNDSIIGMLKSYYEEIISYPDEIRQLFTLIHTKFTKLLSIFAACKSSQPILDNMKPFSTNKKENDRLVEEQIKVNEENKKNFLLKIGLLLKEYFTDIHYKEIKERVFIYQIQPIDENLLKVFSYYYSFQIVELVHCISDDIENERAMKGINMGIAHITLKLLELLFNVTIRFLEEQKKISIERMRNKEEYYSITKGMFTELVCTTMFINNVKSNKLVFDENISQTREYTIQLMLNEYHKNRKYNQQEKKPRRVKN